MLRFIVCPMISYLLAVPFTSRISLSLLETEWLLKVMGLDAVWMVEECEMEAAS